MDSFDSYNVFLDIAINIPVLLMTAFVLQGHILIYYFPFFINFSLLFGWEKFIK